MSGRLLCLSSIILCTIAACTRPDPSNRCETVTCYPPGYGFDYRLVSGSTGADLLFGADKLYEPRTIQYFTLQGGGDTTFHTSLINFGTPAGAAPRDSTAGAQFGIRTPMLFVDLGGGDVDTVFPRYRFLGTGECCGDIYDLEAVRYNDGEEQTVVPTKWVVLRK